MDLDQFSLGGDRSWTRTALGLRDRYGPFVLAYLEAVVRIADWRASAGLEAAAMRQPDDHDHEPATSRPTGLRPEPLASYLAGLGLIRVLGDQADPAATAAWTPDGLVSHHGAGYRRLAGRRLRAGPGGEPVDERQRLRPQG